MSTLSPEVVEAFTTAAVTALQELVQLEVFPEILSPKMESGPVVVATIQLLRDPPGSLSLVLPPDVATNLATRYLPAGTALTPEMIDDVAGEFANVIAGQAKTMLKGTRYHFNLSMPGVVRTDSSRLVSTASVAICLSTEIGTMALRADLDDDETV